MVWLEKHTTRYLTFLSLLAILVAIILFVIQPPDIAIGQTGIWWNISQNVAHGKGFVQCDTSYFPFCNSNNQISASHEPIPVLFFAAIATLTKDSLIAISIIEVFLHILVLWGVFFLTKEWASLRTALLAAAIWAVYPEALRLIPQLSSDLLGTVFVSYGLFFLMHARKTNRLRDWLFSGFCLGLAIMTRSAVLSIFGIIVICLGFELWKGWVYWNKWFITILLISLPAILMIIPWMVRNQIELGKPVIGSTLTGYNVYRENYFIAFSNNFHYVGSDEAYKAISSLIRNRKDLLGIENEAQMDTIYMQEGLRIIQANPVRYISLVGYRFLPLWFNWQVSEAYGTPTDIKDYAIMVLQGFLLILSIIGFSGRMKETWPLWVSILVNCLSYMAVNGQLRYLLPVMPAVISLSSVACLHLISKNQFRWHIS